MILSKKTKPSSDTQMIDQRYDRTLLAIVLILSGIGVVMVFSASVVSAQTQFGNGYYYLQRQLLFLALGLVVMVVTMNLPYQALERLAKPILGVSLLLLVLVLIPGLSTTAKGASRWLNLGVIRLQPSEIAKFAIVVYLSAYLSKHQHELHKFKIAWVPNLAIVGVFAALLMIQPDFGSTVICAGMMILMVWSAGARTFHVTAMLAVALALMVAAVFQKEYRWKRITAFMSPEADPQGVSYQINQALISFGSGDWTGQGLGGSTQKLLYLPDAHTDFIFAIIGEETGLIGAALVVLLFVLFIWRGLHIARNASMGFGALLAFGLTVMIGGQACVNLAVVMAMLPTKGLTLPFISYGGSSLLVLSCCAGVLLNISRRMPPPEWLHSRRGILHSVK